MEVVEEARVAECTVEEALVELGEGDEKVCEATALAGEEVDVSSGELACLGEVVVVHDFTFSCDFQASGNARMASPERFPETGSRTPPGKSIAPAARILAT
jgi:hypothetical protein